MTRGASLEQLRSMRKKRWRDHGGGWPENHRPCVECGEMLPFESFHKHSLCLHGINTVCKDCRKPKSRTQYHKSSIESRIVSRARRRAKEKGLPFNIEEEDIVIPKVCPVLGIELELGNSDSAPSIDRLVPNKGYVKGNVQIISNKANRMKSNASVRDIERLLYYMENKL